MKRTALVARSIVLALRADPLVWLMGGLGVGLFLLALWGGGSRAPFASPPGWPAQTGPWTRALVVAASPEVRAAAPWAVTSLDRLPGRVVPLGVVAPARFLLADEVAHPVNDDPAHRQRLRRLLAPLLTAHRALLVYRVEGRLTEDGRVHVRCTPVALLTPDTLLTPPRPLPARPATTRTGREW